MNFTEFDQIECDYEIRCFAELHGTVWTALGDGALHMRDAATTNIRFTIERYDKEYVWAIAAVVTTDHVWVGYSSGYIRVYNSTGSLMAEMWEHREGVHCLAHCHHTGSVFSGGNDALVLEWDVATFAFFRAYKGHTGPVRCLQVGVASVEVNEVVIMLYTGSDDKTVREWPVSNKGAHKQVDAHLGAVLCMTIVERVLWSAGEDAVIRVGFGAVAVLQSPHERSITVLTAIPGTHFLLSGAVDRSVVLWDAHAMAPVKSFPGCHKGYVHTIGLAMEEVSRCVTLWSTASDRSLRRWQLMITPHLPTMVGYPKMSPPRRSVSSAQNHTVPYQNSITQQSMQDTIDEYKREVWSLKNKETTFKQKIVDVQRMIEAAAKQADQMRGNYNSQVKLLIESIHKKDERLHRCKVAEKKVKDLLRTFQGKDAFLTSQLENVLELLTEEHHEVASAMTAGYRSVRVVRNASLSPTRRYGSSPATPPVVPRPFSPTPNPQFFERQAQAFTTTTILPPTEVVFTSPVPVRAPSPVPSPRRGVYDPKPIPATTTPVVIRKLSVGPRRDTASPDPIVAQMETPPLKNPPVPTADPLQRWLEQPQKNSAPAAASFVAQPQEIKSPAVPEKSTPRTIVTGMKSPDRITAMKAQIKADQAAATPVRAVTPTGGGVAVKQVPSTSTAAAPTEGSVDKVQAEYQRILARLEQMEREY